MRSKIEANEYKDYILGFMFYKYLSDREVSFLKGEKYSDDDIKKVTADDEKLMKHISENIGYFIAYEDLFSTWLSKGDDFDVSDVRDALSNFDTNIEPTYKKLFENIFKTLQSGLSKLGETSTKQTKSIKALLKLIKRWMGSRTMMFWDLFMSISLVCLLLMLERKRENSTHHMKFQC